MKGWVPAAIAAVMIGLGSFWYIGSPWVTLYGMKTAVERRDAEALIAYVDFAALRRNLKDQATRELASNGPRTDVSGWTIPDPNPGRLAAIEQQIDTYVTADTARMLFTRAGPSTQPETGDVGRMLRDITIDRIGLGTFIVRARNGTQGPGFVFKAHGFGWQLSGIDVPGGLAQAMGKRPMPW